jgi:hypothetical protein
VQLRVGWVLRRRRGRGAADYYIATPEKPGRIGLLPQTETAALLMSYAQATAQHERILHAEPTKDGYHLPDVLLPPPHRDMLHTIVERTQGTMLVAAAGWEQAQRLFAALRLRLEARPGT